MARLMSVTLTKDQVRARTKHETRRLGWWKTKNGQRLVVAGDHLTLCEKVMGRRKGEPLVRIVEVEVIEVRRERLDAITPAGVAAEGFPDWTPAQFVDFFCSSMNVTPAKVVTVITWRYPDERSDA